MSQEANDQPGFNWNSRKLRWAFYWGHVFTGLQIMQMLGDDATVYAMLMAATVLGYLGANVGHKWVSR